MMTLELARLRVEHLIAIKKINAVKKFNASTTLASRSQMSVKRVHSSDAAVLTRVIRFAGDGCAAPTIQQAYQNPSIPLRSTPKS